MSNSFFSFFGRKNQVIQSNCSGNIQTNGSITINGKKIDNASGSNIQIKNGKVIVDGVDINKDDDSKILNITIIGDVKNIDIDNCNEMNIEGNVEKIKTGTSCTVKGNVVRD